MFSTHRRAGPYANHHTRFLTPGALCPRNLHLSGMKRYENIAQIDEGVYHGPMKRRHAVSHPSAAMQTVSRLTEPMLRDFLCRRSICQQGDP